MTFTAFASEFSEFEVGSDIFVGDIIWNDQHTSPKKQLA